MSQYQTAFVLGITEQEHQALILTIDVLRNEQVVFNMGTQCDVRNPDGSDGSDEISTNPLPPCRTALCIGGTMKLLMLNDMKLPELVTPEMGDKIVKYVDDEGLSMRELFYGCTSQGVQPEEGIAAIEQFLTGNTWDPWNLGGRYEKDLDY